MHIHVRLRVHGVREPSKLHDSIQTIHGVTLQVLGTSCLLQVDIEFIRQDTAGSTSLELAEGKDFIDRCLLGFGILITRFLFLFLKSKE